jgi:hypothetical protein
MTGKADLPLVSLVGRQLTWRCRTFVQLALPGVKEFSNKIVRNDLGKWNLSFGLYEYLLEGGLSFG